MEKSLPKTRRGTHARPSSELKLEYGWRWFSFHAKQRVTMVYFFLLASGVLANAYALLLRDDDIDHVLPIGIAAVGFICSLVFLGLEARNRQLVDLGEDVLRALEGDALFRKGTGSADVALARYGILRREALCGHPLLITHTVLFPVLELTVAVAFLGAGLYAALGT